MLCILRPMKRWRLCLAPSNNSFAWDDVDHSPVRTACSVQLIVTAAHMLGIGAIWKTGNATYSGEVSRILGLDDSEQVVAMIYLGRPVANLPQPPEVDPETFLTRL